MKVQVAVIGAGSAGISAFRQLMKAGSNAVLIDPGPLGTMCARTGCMPSKALIRVANDFHRRQIFEREGIRGAEKLTCDIPAALAHVRQLRDHFAAGMVETTEELAGDRLIREKAVVRDRHTVETDHWKIKADNIIIATGAKPVVPEAWQAFSDRILTHESLFEQESLPQRLAVIGLKVEGLELGQALARLGVEVNCFGRNRNIGGVTDPIVNEVLHKTIGAELPIHSGAEARVNQQDAGSLQVEAGDISVTVDRLLLCMGTVPRLAGLGLENLDFELDENGMPPFHPQSGQIADLPVYLAGDVNEYRPVLHEALDEGLISGRNATGQNLYAKRRIPMRICFSDPQAVVVGKSWEELPSDEITVGTVDFEEQSRAVLEGRNQGCLHLYADRQSGLLLGAEMAAPEAEYLGHILSLAMQQAMTVSDLLKIPYYHPTLTEALRAALHDAADRCGAQHTPSGLDLSRNPT